MTLRSEFFSRKNKQATEWDPLDDTQEQIFPIPYFMWVISTFI